MSQNLQVTFDETQALALFVRNLSFETILATVKTQGDDPKVTEQKATDCLSILHRVSDGFNRTAKRLKAEQDRKIQQGRV